MTLKQALQAMPEREKAALRELMEAINDSGDYFARMAFRDYLTTRGKIIAKDADGIEGDKRRRILVGARVQRPFAEQCKRAAALSGRSLYRFVCDALERELTHL